MREIRAHSSLRGIAAISVFLAHAELDRVLPAHGWWLSFYKFFYWQNPAVDLFFMLSGFVLNYVYLKHRRLEWGSYIVARLARICPLYYAGMGVMLAMNLYAVRHGQPASPNLHQPVILRNLTMTQEWPVGPSQISVILAAWSISVEMFLYLIVFPLLAKLFTGRVIPVRVILPCLLGLLVIDSLISYENIFGIVLPYARLMRGVVGFSVGLLVCELIVRRIHPWMDKGQEIVLLIGSIIAMPFIAAHMALPFLFAALLAATYSEHSWLGQKLSVPILNYLGTISYSIYIWHMPCMKAVTIACGLRQLGGSAIQFPSTGSAVFYVVVLIVTVMGVSTASYYCFEDPLRRIISQCKGRNILVWAKRVKRTFL